MNAVGPRRQQAWPAEHHVGMGGVGATGYGFAAPFGASSFGQYQRAGAPSEGPGVSVVGGELVF